MNSRRDVVPSECVQSLNSNGYFARYENVHDSIRSLGNLYVRKYAGRTPNSITKVYAGNPQSKGYWEAIQKCYE